MGDYQIITNEMGFDEVEELLDDFGIQHPWGWEVVMGRLLSQCDYIEIHGVGSNAKFKLINKKDE